MGVGGNSDKFLEIFFFPSNVPSKICPLDLIIFNSFFTQKFSLAYQTIQNSVNS
jgi:hypothetical protein